MHLITLLAALITTSQATPVNTKVDALDSACIYICTSANWTGTCQNLCDSTGICVNLPFEPSSLGPAKGISGVQLFSASDCKESGQYMDSEDAAAVQYPGLGDLRTFEEGRFEKNVGSLIAY